jgi:phosphate:Na+ symporter
VIDVFRNPDVKMGKVIEDIQTKENTVDLLEKEISDFLVKVSQNAISTEQSQTITSMLHMVNEIERIGDHCERLLKLLRRKYSHKYEFTGEANSAIEEMSDKITKFLELLSQTLMEPKNILPKADVLENRIDELRKEMRKNHVARLNEGTCDVNSGLVYIDMVTSFEKIGDHAFNVAEGLSGERVN